MKYYKILDVDVDAEKTAIKNAYFLKLRQYPAEVYPEQFQEIQEAYQILIDDKKRSDYDTYELYGEKITALRREALKEFDSENFKAANVLLEQLIEFIPNDGSVLNLYGLTNFELGNIETAIQSWKKALTVDESNGVYHYNLGTGYEKLEDYTKAIRCYKQAILCNPLEYYIIKHLSSLYIYLNDFENAWNIVELTMKKPVIRGELKIVFIKRLVEVATLINGQFEMKLALKYADKLIDENPKLKEALYVEFYNFALMLARGKNYYWSWQVIQYVLKLDPTNQQVVDMYNEIKVSFQIYDEFDKLVDDGDVPKEFRVKIYTYLYPEEVEEIEVDEVNDRIYELSIDDPSKVRKGIRRLKQEYPAISDDMQKWVALIESLL